MRLLALWWLLWLALPAAAGELVVDFLDVGQGDAILVRTADKAVLVDAGEEGSGVADQLRALGVERLDLVVATHAHADHIGGLPAVLRSFEVGLFLDNGQPHATELYESVMGLVASRSIPYRVAVKGMSLHLGEEAALEVLHPGKRALANTRSDQNANSVVLLLVHQAVRVLLVGDAEEPTEWALVRQRPGPVDVLKVAHHGSRYSSSNGFLRHISPDVAVISAGRGNPFGHPHTKALIRLEAAGASLYRTDQQGAVRLTSDGTGYEITTQRARSEP